MKLSYLLRLCRELYSDKQRGLLLQEHTQTRDRITRSRLKDLPTHAKYIAKALDRPTANEVDATELTAESRERVAQYLRDESKGIDVVTNTLSSFNLLRDLANEEGASIFVLPKLERPKRHRVYQREVDGHHRKIAKSNYVSNNAPYGLRYRDWPASLKAEYSEIVRFHTDEFAEHRSKNLLRSSTISMRLNRFERAFGIELLRGVALEDLSFRTVATLSVLAYHRKFLYERNGNQDTMTAKGYLDMFRSLALDYFQEKEQANAISMYMRNRCKFKAIKDKHALVERVHADDLHLVLACLVAEARDYEANLRQKHNRRHPEAQMAYHWHQAAVWGFTLATLLRQENVARATAQNIYRKNDGTWHYRFAASEMKSDRAKADEVIDLWRGDEALGLIRLALDKASETRHYLIARFRANNPGQPDPEEFFLNMDGKGYRPSAMRMFFTSAAVRYLGPEKRISQHDIRTIIPSWLLVREGANVVDALSNHLGHANVGVTLKHYIKIQNIFGARLALLQMQERQKQQKALANLQKLPDQVAGLLHNYMRDIDAKLESLREAHDPEIIEHLKALREAVFRVPPSG